MSKYGYITHSELAHHGIKGQKWGVRHYQNEDGSYKPGAEGRYYSPIRSLFKLRRNIVEGKGERKRRKIEEKAKATAIDTLTKQDSKQINKPNDKKVVDKNSLAAKRAVLKEKKKKYDRAAAIATSAITAASIAGMGALMVGKSIKNKKAVQNAMLKLVDNKIGGTSIKGSSVAKAALTGAKLSSKGKDNARAELRRLTNKGIDNARAFTSKQVVSKAIRTTPNSTKAHLIYDPKGFAKYNAQLLKKKKR